MAIYHFDGKNPSLITRNSNGRVSSIFWEWNYGAIGAVIGDDMRAAFDLTKLYDGANNVLLDIPPVAYVQHKIVTAAANSRTISKRDATSNFPMLNNGVQGAAFDNVSGTDRAFGARITCDTVLFRLLLAADASVGDFMRFGFLYDF